MIKTTLEEFREELLATGGYKTKDDHRAPFRAKPSALATLGFSYNVMRVFPSHSASLIRRSGRISVSPHSLVLKSLE